MFFILLLNVLFNSSFIQPDSTSPGPWERKNITDDGIAIYIREYPNTNIKEIKAICKIKAPPLNVFKAAMSRETFKDLNRYLVEYRKIKTENENLWYVYQRVSVPLVKDRDYTHRYEAIRDSVNNKYSISWHIDNENGPPPVEDVIRVEISSGTLTISPEKNGRYSLLTYQMLFDPGGSIPKWLVNFANKYTLPDILRVIRKYSSVNRNK